VLVRRGAARRGPDRALRPQPDGGRADNRGIPVMPRRSQPVAVPLPPRNDAPASGARPVENAVVLEADVDGTRVRVTARDEVVIACGKASITLRRNGRVVIRGTHVETLSSGTNRIKGGQVRVN